MNEHQGRINVHKVKSKTKSKSQRDNLALQEYNQAIEKKIKKNDMKFWGISNAASSPSRGGLEVRRISRSQPRVAEALSRCRPPLRTVIQHPEQEVREGGGLLQLEVIFLHQDVVQAPQSLRTNPPQVTCMHVSCEMLRLLWGSFVQTPPTSAVKVLGRVPSGKGHIWWDFTQDLHNLSHVVWGNRRCELFLRQGLCLNSELARLFGRWLKLAQAFLPQLGV